MRYWYGKPWYEQSLDQFGHFALAFPAGSGLASVTWHGILAGISIMVLLAARELKQWPPHPDRPLDPALDTAFYVLGIMAGMVVGSVV